MRARKTIPASKFKAACLDALDRVAESGEVVIITRKGRPIAKLVPIVDEPAPSLRGSVTYHGDIVAPTGESWDADA